MPARPPPSAILETDHVETAVRRRMQHGRPLAPAHVRLQLAGDELQAARDEHASMSRPRLWRELVLETDGGHRCQQLLAARVRQALRHDHHVRLEGGCIAAHVVIENDVRIGPGTILHPHVFVGAGSEIGRDCEIHPHTSIGSDGFGYAVGASRRPQKISHLGNVVIGDEVEIGSNCAIDRAKLASTHIRSGAKLDNICHIAHNCDLGEDGFYTAGFMMAGSTTIGRRFMTGGNSVVSAHLTLADDVVLAGRSTVTADVTEAGHYGGYPLQPLKDAMRTIASLGQINEMRKSLNRLSRHLRLPERS